VIEHKVAKWPHEFPRMGAQLIHMIISAACASVRQNPNAIFRIICMRLRRSPIMFALDRQGLDQGVRIYRAEPFDLAGTARADTEGRLEMAGYCNGDRGLRLWEWYSFIVAGLLRWPLQAWAKRMCGFRIRLPIPAEIFVELHEFGRLGDGFFHPRQFEDCVAAYNLLGLGEWAVYDAEFAAFQTHLFAGGQCISRRCPTYDRP